MVIKPMQDIPKPSAEAKAAAAAGELQKRLMLVADRRALTADCAADVSMDTDDEVLLSQQPEENTDEEAREHSPAVDTPTVASEPRRMVSASLLAAAIQPDAEEVAGAAVAPTCRPLQTKRQRMSPLPQPPATRQRTAQHCHQHQDNSKNQHTQQQHQHTQQQHQQHQQITALRTVSNGKLEGQLSQAQLLLQSTANVQVPQGALRASSSDGRSSLLPSDGKRHPTRGTCLSAVKTEAASEVDGPLAAAVVLEEAAPLQALSPAPHQPPCFAAEPVWTAPDPPIATERQVESEPQAPSDLQPQQLEHQPLPPELASSREARLEEENMQLRAEVERMRQKISFGVAEQVQDGSSRLDQNKQVGHAEVLGQAITLMAPLAPVTFNDTGTSGSAAGSSENQPHPVLVRCNCTPLVHQTTSLHEKPRIWAEQPAPWRSSPEVACRKWLRIRS